MRAIVRLCEQATRIDPAYPQAWALMALGYRGLRELGKQVNDRMAAVERALALDPGLADDEANHVCEAYARLLRAALTPLESRIMFGNANAQRGQWSGGLPELEARHAVMLQRYRAANPFVNIVLAEDFARP